MATQASAPAKTSPVGSGGAFTAAVAASVNEHPCVHLCPSLYTVFFVSFIF